MDQYDPALPANKISSLITNTEKHTQIVVENVNNYRLDFDSYVKMSDKLQNFLKTQAGNLLKLKLVVFEDGESSLYAKMINQETKSIFLTGFNQNQTQNFIKQNKPKSS